ncbi:unnamed protein product [Paramecium pentaurelia]|uniref:Uncharacterized protein n=1 Tax=Paramecium pentaurelia TaxID=43138 RepID=A0A8S1V285_9CILI|nr:unnamed protein product [Paramecium pentaurelia]
MKLIKRKIQGISLISYLSLIYKRYKIQSEIKYYSRYFRHWNLEMFKFIVNLRVNRSKSQKYCAKELSEILDSKKTK